MKTAKKLFSLLLVAVLLMSAIPFQADATGEGTQTPTVTKYVIAFYNQVTGAPMGTPIEFPGTATSMVPTAAQIPDTTYEGYTFDGWTKNLEIGFLPGDFHESSTTGVWVLDVFAKYTQNCPHAEWNSTVTAPDCENPGFTTHVCKACGETKVDTPTAKLGHNMSAYVRDGAYANTETSTCQNGCGHTDTRNISEVVTFINTVIGEEQTKALDLGVQIGQGNNILPQPSRTVHGKEFNGWFTEPTGGVKLGSASLSTFTGNPMTYYAQYVDSTNDDDNTITLYYRITSDNITGSALSLSYTIENVEDGADLLDVLKAHESEITAKLGAKLDLDKYARQTGYYVLNTTNGTERAMYTNEKVNGDTSVVIKLNAQESIRATVIVYVHKAAKADDPGNPTYTMAGYTVGDEVTLGEVETLLKSKGVNYKVNELYSRHNWLRKIDDSTTAGEPMLRITEKVLEVHVLAPNFRASSSSTSSKPASNPATGDTIMITAGIMVLSAAAFVTLTQLRKRKMI